MNLRLFFVLLALTPIAAGQEPDLVEKAKRFRSLIAAEQWEEAREMMAPDPRRWFEEKEGEGRPWSVGPNSGPWAAWDDEFGSSSTVVDWRGGSSSATVRILEINDYFRLLDRGAVTNEITYYFDDQGRIEGLLIRAVGDRPEGRTKEFLRWALENEARELRELMPKGEIDPSGDHPQRFRALLERWREASGLHEIPERENAPSAIPETGPLIEVSERFVRGWLEGDEEKVMSTLTDDAVLMPHHGAAPVEGDDAIRAFWFPDGPSARVTVFEQTYDEVRREGEIGWARGRFALAFDWQGTSYRNEGNFMMLFRRNAAGEWKITHRIWNDPVQQQER